MWGGNLSPGFMNGLGVELFFLFGKVIVDLSVLLKLFDWKYDRSLFIVSDAVKSSTLLLSFDMLLLVKEKKK